MSNDAVLHELVIGYRLPKPESCSNVIFAQVERCWLADPALRPSFAELVESLKKLAPGFMSEHELERAQQSDFADVSDVYTRAIHPAAVPNTSRVFLSLFSFSN